MVSSNTMRDDVIQLFESGIRQPQLILNELERTGKPQPPKSQLKNFLAYYKMKNFGPPSISLAELQQWCDRRKEIPEELDQVYVPSYEVEDHEDIQQAKVRIFFTTKRLLDMTRYPIHLATDANYKLTWQGFPVIMVGSTDKNKSFHTFGLAVTTNETHEDFAFVFSSLKTAVQSLFNRNFSPTTVLADGSDAITNGFTQVFGQPEKRIMCYAHVI